MKKKLDDKTLRFERRDLLKILTSVPAAALVSATPFASRSAEAMPQQSAVQEGSAHIHPRVLDPHEWKTIRVLSDLIIPADQQSGSASQAGVPEFIDDWLELMQGDLLSEIRGGLTWLDMECNRSFGNDFVDCPAAQQEQILDRIAFPEKAAPEDKSAAFFFSSLRDLVVSGFFTSKMGIKDLPYVGNEPQSAWEGCPTPVLAKLGISKEKTVT